MVPTFTTHSVGQRGAQLYSGSIATVTPQSFTVASPPEQEPGFGVDRRRNRDGHALHTGPYPPDLSRLNPYGASTTGSLSLHRLTSLDGPAPSGSTGTSRRCRGCSRPPQRSPGQAAPSFTRPLRRPGGGGLSPPLDCMMLRGALLSRLKLPVVTG
jgi:hypothetical protein